MLRISFTLILLFFAQIVLGQLRAVKLNPAINSRDFDEISPRVSPDGKLLFFTRLGYPVYDKTLLINGRDWGQSPAYNFKLRTIFGMLGGSLTVNPETSDFNQDIWYATHQAGVFDRLHHAAYPLNNALPNSVCSFSADGNTIYVINKFGANGGMEPGFSKSTRYDGTNWSFPSPLEIADFYTKSSGIHMAMSEDEKIIIMSLMREDSYGGTDLYVSFKQGKDRYSVPINLGPNINSEFNEEAPFICSDNKTLYFSSDRPGPYGGKDIYKAIRQDVTWESWKSPEALPEPINSRKDDNQPFYHPGTSFFYFVSTREVSSDIYRATYTETLQEKDPENTVYAAIDPVVDNEPKPVYSFVSPAATVLRDLQVTVVDGRTNSPINANLTYTSVGNKSEVALKDGKAQVRVPEKDVLVTATLDNYITYERLVPSSEILELMDNDEVLTIKMDELVENGKIYTDPIYFIQSRAIVKQISFPALNRLVRTLRRHWQVSITIEGHTDNQGEPEQLLQLSEDRARAVKDYLVKKGISPLRIDPVGVGGNKPLNDNSTDELRQENRRVEVIISKIFNKG